MEENNYLCNPNNKNIKEPFMDFKETFKRYGLNISSMAEKMGIAQPSLSRKIATGTIDVRELQQMADICKVSLSEFVGADAPKEITLSFNGEEHIYQLKGE